jgi:hypothetical protein
MSRLIFLKRSFLCSHWPPRDAVGRGGKVSTWGGDSIGHCGGGGEGHVNKRDTRRIARSHSGCYCLHKAT